MRHYNAAFPTGAGDGLPWRGPVGAEIGLVTKLCSNTKQQKGIEFLLSLASFLGANVRLQE